MKNRLNLLYHIFFGVFYGVLIFLAAEVIQAVIVYGLVLPYYCFEFFKLKGNQGENALPDLAAIVDAAQKAMSQDILYLISVIGVIGCGIAFFFWYKNETRGEVRGSLQTVLQRKNLILLIVTGLGCQIFTSGAMNTVRSCFDNLFADYAKQIDQLTNGNIISVVLLMIIIAPVTEELVFRGVILHKANRYMSFLGANILQALLFGVYHQNIVQGVYAALLGFLFGFVYYKFKTIFASMIVHMVNNASALLIVLCPDNQLIYLTFIFVGGIFLFTALYLLKPSDTLAPNKPDTRFIQNPKEEKDDFNDWN